MRGTPVALEIFGVACKAVLKVFLIAAVGCWARHAGLLDARTAKAMSKVNGTVFLPCLLFVALGRSVTVEHLRNVWLLPLAAVTNITMGACMGAALLRILRIPDGFRGPAVAASAFGNSLALPVVLISAVISSGKVGHLTFTEEDEGAALLYLGAYMTTLTIFMWSVGPAMMRAESVNSTAAVAAEGGSARGAGAHEGVSSGGKVRGGGGDGGGSSGGVPPGGDGGIEIEIEMTPSGGGGDGGGGRAEEASSAVEAVGLDAVKWDAARDTRVAVDEDDDDGAPLVLVETDGDEELLTLRGEEKEAGAARGGGGGYGGGGGRAAAAGKQQRRRPAKSVSEVCLTTRRPPLYRRVATVLAPAANNNVVASILGIVVGVIPPLRAALFEADGALYVFADAATIVSGAAIPTVIVILGASLANGPDHSLCDRQTALSIATVRLAAMPLLNVCIFLALRATLSASAVPSSPAFWLVFLVEGAMPTANNMMLQVQMYGSQAAAGGIGACLFWQYALAPVLLTGTMSLFLVLI